MDLPEGFQLDPALSQRMGTMVAVNPTTGKRIRYKGKGAANPAKIYAESRARKDADRDVSMLEEARLGERDAYGMEATAKRGEAILDKTPTGPMADFRIEAGKALQEVPFAGVLPLVPSKQETDNLQEMRNIGSMGALGDVSKLRGPLSEKELVFIRQMQVDPNASKGANRRVLEVMKWVARRQAAYGRAMQAWDRRLGSPTAANKDGLTFDAWWGRYAAEKLPPPGVGAAVEVSMPDHPERGVGRAGGGVSKLSDEELKAKLGL